MSDSLGGHLVDRNPGVDVGAGGLADAHAGQKCAARSRVVAGTVQPAVGVDVVQPAHDLDLVLDLLERLQGAVELEVLPFLLGPPVALMHAVGNVDEGHPQRGTRSRGRRQREPLSAAAINRGATRDSKAGKASETPTPRKNFRRQRLVWPLGGLVTWVRLVWFHGLPWF